MKVVLFHQHGGSEVLEYADFPTPEPKPGEALIRLHAAALNRVDVGIDNMGTAFMQSLRAFRKVGLLLTIGNSAGPTFEKENFGRSPRIFIDEAIPLV